LEAYLHKVQLEACEDSTQIRLRNEMEERVTDPVGDVSTGAAVLRASSV